MVADILAEVLGELLLTDSLDGDSMPSPEQLKHQILVKGKCKKVGNALSPISMESTSSIPGELTDGEESGDNYDSDTMTGEVSQVQDSRPRSILSFLRYRQKNMIARRAQSMPLPTEKQLKEPDKVSDKLARLAVYFKATKMRAFSNCHKTHDYKSVSSFSEIKVKTGLRDLLFLKANFIEEFNY